MAAATPASLVTKPKPRPTPPQFIRLTSLNAEVNDRYVTRAGDDLASVWYWEDYPGSEDPSLDRDFLISDLEAVVAWLGRKESHGGEEKEADQLGWFYWYGEMVIQRLPCGDTYEWELASLRLFIRAFKRMEIAESDPVFE